MKKVLAKLNQTHTFKEIQHVINTPNKKKKISKKTKAAISKVAQRIMAAIGAAFLPVASSHLSHTEAKEQMGLWFLVGAALTFSIPQLVKWVDSWSPSKWFYKGIGFAVLLEFTMIFSHTTWLIYSALAILVAINSLAAWTMAGKFSAIKKS